MGLPKGSSKPVNLYPLRIDWCINCKVFTTAFVCLRSGYLSFYSVDWKFLGDVRLREFVNRPERQWYAVIERQTNSDR
jgi:hypothetical protein